MSEESTIHPSIKSTSDLSDKLSPMLVKELRQGLKGMTFMILFIAVQAFLSVVILGQSFSESYDNTGRNISTTIFICIGLATCVLQPLRAISAIGSEVKENTIDLMVITKLSAWRIVFGKWISLVSQSALIIAAIAPYLIVRYFFGGMQLFAELFILFSFFIASAGITAFFIGISALPSLIFRGLIGLSCASIIFTLITSFFANSREYSAVIDIFSFQIPEALYVYMMLVLGLLYLAWLSLDYAAGTVAPLSENRSTPRRLICLGIVAGLFIIFWMSSSTLKETSPTIMLLLSIPIAIISITEHPYPIAVASVPFVKKGVWGRVSSYLFYPGWASGLNFIMLLFGLTLLSIFFYDTSHITHPYSSNYLIELMSIVSICFSCVVFPLLLVRLFFTNTLKIFVFYIGALAAMGTLWLIVTIIAYETSSPDLFSAFCWLPPVQFNILHDYQHASSAASGETLVHSIALPTFIIYWIVCSVTSLKFWKHIRANDLQAINIIEAQKTLTETK